MSIGNSWDGGEYQSELDGPIVISYQIRSFINTGLAGPVDKKLGQLGKYLNMFFA